MTTKIVYKAKNFTPQSVTITYPVNNETRDLSVAWLKGEISLSQIRGVYKKIGQATIYSLITRSLRDCYEKGILIIK